MDLLESLAGRTDERSCCAEPSAGARSRDRLKPVAQALLGKAVAYAVRRGPAIVDRALDIRANRSRRRLEGRTPAMDDSHLTPLPVLAAPAGGCGCCTPATPVPSNPLTPAQERVMTVTVRHPVVGLTCAHCVGAVTEEILVLAGVRSVDVDLVAGGTSTVTITSDDPVPDEALAAALDEAGDYRLVTD
jgi:copper chaperone